MVCRRTLSTSTKLNHLKPIQAVKQYEVLNKTPFQLMLCLSNPTVNLQTADQAAHMIYIFEVHPKLRILFSTKPAVQQVVPLAQ